MSQAPERLDLYFTNGRPLMKAVPNGRYVRSSDYDALAAERDALREYVTDLHRFASYVSDAVANCREVDGNDLMGLLLYVEGFDGTSGMITPRQDAHKTDQA